MDPQVAIHSYVGSIRRSLPELNCSSALKAFIRFTTPDPVDCVVITVYIYIKNKIQITTRNTKAP